VTPFLVGLAPSLAAFLVQTTLLACLVLATGRLARRRGVGFEVAVYRAGVLSILALVIAGPLLTQVLHPAWVLGATGMRPPMTPTRDQSVRVGAVRAVPQSAQFTSGPKSPPSPEIAVGRTEPSAPETNAPVKHGSPSVSLAEILVLVWLAGVLAQLALLLAGGVYVEWLRRSSSRTPLINHPGISLARSNRVRSAFMAGLRNPTIFLPADLEGVFDADEIEAIMAHELTHAKRCDCRWTLLSKLAGAIAWPNPLMLLIGQRLTSAGEELCDQCVLAAGFPPVLYAGCLMKVAESFVATPTQRLVGAGVYPAKSQLSRRISKMLTHAKPEPTSLSPRTRIGIVAAASAAILTSCLLAAAAPIRHEDSPAATVTAMIDAINARDWKATFSRIEGADVPRVEEAIRSLGRPQGIPPVRSAIANADGRIVYRASTGLFSMPRISASAVGVDLTGDQATVHLSLSYAQPHTLLPSMPTKDDVHLVRLGGDWKVVDGNGELSIFTQLGQLGRNPELVAKYHLASQRTQVLSDLKQISLAVLMYINDHDDRFMLDQSNLKARLHPYLKNEAVWFGPDGKPLDVRFNSNLKSRSADSIEQPAVTVLLHVGPRGNLRFFGNGTPIAFADGHVKFMTGEGLSQMTWK
jgi:prepilin-type processing-associated H-X9-DG protein